MRPSMKLSTESMTRYTGQTDRYRDQFVGILSHDLRNPLGAIIAGAALLARAGEDDPVRPEWPRGF